MLSNVTLDHPNNEPGVFVLTAAFFAGLDADQVASLTGRVSRIVTDGFAPNITPTHWWDKVTQYEKDAHSSPVEFGAYTSHVRDLVTVATKVGPPQDRTRMCVDVLLEDYAHLARFQVDSFLTQVAARSGIPFTGAAARFVAARAAWLTGSHSPEWTGDLVDQVTDALVVVPGRAWVPTDHASGYAYGHLTGPPPPNPTRYTPGVHAHDQGRTGQGT